MIDVDGLTASTDYTFSVRAKDKAGNLSEPSKAVPVTTQATLPNDDEPPTVPAKLTGRADGSRGATLTWGRRQGRRRRHLVRHLPGGLPDPQRPRLRDHGEAHGLRPGTVYTFHRPGPRRLRQVLGRQQHPRPHHRPSAPGAPASTAPTGLRTEVGKEGDLFTLDLSWDQPDTGGTIPAYELHMNGKLTTTIVWGGTPPQGAGHLPARPPDPAGTRYSVKLRAKLPDGKWGDFSAQRTVVLAD